MHVASDECLPRSRLAFDQDRRGRIACEKLELVERTQERRALELE
jgi:hypothetical protein